ncbi:hypothetical protein [Bosea sp. 117]|uniref:hypothetical protein n=1 Tax=Bosea sp. 117 TaxID=1125973 RepID=UPI000493FBE7|nr:hypothetical protein [Bosea sp. 117]
MDDILLRVPFPPAPRFADVPDQERKQLFGLSSDLSMVAAPVTRFHHAVRLLEFSERHVSDARDRRVQSLEALDADSEVEDRRRILDVFNAFSRCYGSWGSIAIREANRSALEFKAAMLAAVATVVQSANLHGKVDVELANAAVSAFDERILTNMDGGQVNVSDSTTLAMIDILETFYSAFSRLAS